MVFFSRHKNVLLPMTGALIVLLLVIAVCGMAQPQRLLGKAFADDGEGVTEVVDMQEPADGQPALGIVDGRTDGWTDLSNATALRELELVGWGDVNGIIEQSDLAQHPTVIEGLTLALRLAGEETEVFTAALDEPSVNAPSWGRYYVGYAVEAGLIEANSDATRALTTAEYITQLVYALNAQGIEADASVFEKFSGQALNYAVMGNLTYYALALKETAPVEVGIDGRELTASTDVSNLPEALTVPLTDELAGTNEPIEVETVTLADCLIGEGVIDRDTAILADLPVIGNDSATYKKLFVESLKNESKPFVYTAKNKALMLELMNDNSTEFVLVNKTHRLSAEFVPVLQGELTLPAKGNMVSMQPYAYSQLQNLFTAATNDGCTLFARSGYRSYSVQRGLYGSGSNAYRAAPGASEHQTGLAMDVVNSRNALSPSYADSTEARWIRSNAYKYGFVVRYAADKVAVTGYPAEWWHVRYLGKTIAYELQTNNLAYEEFYDLCKY